MGIRAITGAGFISIYLFLMQILQKSKVGCKTFWVTTRTAEQNLLNYLT